MKKATYILLFAVAAILIFSGFKGGNGFTIEVSNSYAVATKASEVDIVAARLNMEEDAVASYFKENELVFIAVSSDGKTQIRISRLTDDFSSAVYDAENLTDKQAAQMISLYSESYDTADVIESGGRKFAKTAETLKDSGGVYTATQYVTVGGGETYVISCYNAGNGTSAEVEDIFSTFALEDMSTRINNYDKYGKWLIPFIIITCGAVGITVFGLCKKLFEK